MDGFLRSITPDKVVDLQIGGNTCDPSKYRVSSHLLTQLSEVLAAHIHGSQTQADNGSFGDRLTLAFPNGKTEPWKLLLFWAYNKRLPKPGEWDEDFAILIDAWALGQELAVPAFQDAIMLELLNWHAEFEIDFLAYVCEKLEPGSEISRFFAEEAVYAVGIEGIGLEDDGDLSDDGMDVGEEEHLARLDPAMSDLLAVAQSSEECRRADARFSKYGWALFERYEQGRVEGRRWWMEFMVSPKGKQGVHGGPNGAVTSCFEEETLAQAVNRVCDEEEMMNTAVVREEVGGEDGDSKGDEVEVQEDGAAKVVDERSDPETGHDCCEIAIDEE